MIPLLIAGGAVGTAVAWRLVAREARSVWVAMGALFGVLGAASLATGRVEWCARVTTFTAIGLGLGSGAVLFAATRVFVAIASSWPAFRVHVAEVYDQRRGLSLGAALALAVLLVSPGEEAFWRGLVQGRLAAETSRLGGAFATWGLYVVANAASGRLPIVAAALVGGAVWGALAWWTGGILAALACHAVWTGLMLALPPKEAAR